MPPRSLSNLSSRSPICVSRWDDASCGSSVEYTKSAKDAKGSISLVKSVHFAEHNEVFEITHLDDIPSSVVADVWYDGAEYSEIKKSYQLTIFLMESGEKLTGEDHTSRGLEYRTQEGAWARYENKRDAYNAVLDEQDRQWKEDIDDWDTISSVYLEHSTKCLKAAYERGVSDQKEIVDYIQDVQKSSSEKKVKKKKKVKGEKESKSSTKKKKKSSSSSDSISSGRRSEVREDIKKESKKKSSKSSKEKRDSV
jgi:hypothetical protein